MLEQSLGLHTSNMVPRRAGKGGKFHSEDGSRWTLKYVLYPSLPTWHSPDGVQGEGTHFLRNASDDVGNKGQQIT